MFESTLPWRWLLYDGLELADRYRLSERLGRGGMGEVWKGVDLRLRRPVAVKLLPLPQDADPASAVRFRREAEISAHLGHLNITVVYDIDEHQDVLFLVMELLDGDDLRKVMDHEPLGLPVSQTLNIAIQVSDGLAAAHARGVVHRDVKPANLIRLSDGTIKICDFGIAWFAESTAGLTSQGLLGTPAYMAPEQFNGGPVDGRTDLYALTLYIVNGFRRGHDKHTVYGYLARSDTSWSAEIARRVLARMRPALIRAGASQEMADAWAQTLADLLAGGRFGTDLAAGFNRETRYSVPATVDFELRLLNSAGRSGETGPLVLSQTDRQRLKHISKYVNWLLAESQQPPPHTDK
jgi:serine/threonine protein kinase